MAGLVRAWTPVHLLLLVCAYAALWILSGVEAHEVAAAWIFAPVGVFGAIIANATGTGGGVVFVPVFAAFELPGEEVVAIAFAIQCFGMSVGALVWARAIFVRGDLAWNEELESPVLGALVFAPLATGIPALLLTQAFVELSADAVIFWFKIFSLALGSILLVFAWSQRRQSAKARRLHVGPRDLWTLLGLGAIGGAATAIFSVGIGEFLAIYLILRRFPTRAAIAVAVWVSVVCVIVGVWDGLLAGHVRPDVTLAAIPGAMAGGLLAKWIASLLGNLWLKTFAASWIVASSLFLLVRA